MQCGTRVRRRSMVIYAGRRARAARRRAAHGLLARNACGSRLRLSPRAVCGA